MFGFKLSKLIRSAYAAVDKMEAETLCRIVSEFKGLSRKCSSGTAGEVINLAACATDAILNSDPNVDCSFTRRWLSIASEFAPKCSEPGQIEAALLHTAYNTAYICYEQRDCEGVRAAWDVAAVESRAFLEGDRIAQYLAEIARTTVLSAASSGDESTFEKSLSYLLKLAHQRIEDRATLLILVRTLNGLEEGSASLKLLAESKCWRAFDFKKAKLFTSDKELASGLTIAIYFLLESTTQVDVITYWATQTRALSYAWFDDVEIQGRISHAAFKVFVHKGVFNVEDEWSHVLLSIGKRFPTVPQIQANVAGGALNACYSISGLNLEPKTFDLKIRPWIDVLIETLGPSGQTEALSPLLALALQHVWRESREFSRLCFAFNQYWPGYIFYTVGTEKRMHFGDLLLNTSFLGNEEFSEQIAKVKQLRDETAEICELARSISDPSLVQYLWVNRMHLHDRGDSLLPLLTTLGLAKELEEYRSEPWRVENRWQPIPKKTIDPAGNS